MRVFQHAGHVEARAADGGDEGRHAVRPVERADDSRLAGALGRHARLVRRRLPGQRQERRDHERPQRHRDPARDWHQVGKTIDFFSLDYAEIFPTNFFQNFLSLLVQVV